MIKIEPVQLNITLPNTKIGIVMMQPFFKYRKINDRYCWQDDEKNKQIERIIKTIKIAKTSDHNCEETYFILLPEYSIPGLDGIHKLQETLAEQFRGYAIVVVGGVDGLTKEEYTCLCNEDKTTVNAENAPGKIVNNQWVNCCILLEKTIEDSVRKWIQPKLVPSWNERNISSNDMFCGKSVYIFNCKFSNGVDCYFLALICFDWIGQINSREGIWAVLSEIENNWRNSGRKDINFIFVLQNNDEPNHRDFLENAKNYFESRGSFVSRDNCVIVFVNTAGGILPGKYDKYGYSSLVCSPSAPYVTDSCPPTFAVRTSKLRGADYLGRCKDAVFREMGACIHSFGFYIPLFMNLGPSGKNLIINRATVHAIDEGICDSRVPGETVPASVKWVNDELDSLKHFLFHKSASPIRDNIKDRHEEILNGIRKCSDDSLRNIIQWTVFEYDKWVDSNKTIHDVDNWGKKEKQGLETIVYACSIIKACYELEIVTPAAHATLKIGTNVFDILIVFGGETSEKCSEYGERLLKHGARFGVIITNDLYDASVNKRMRSICDPTVGITERGPNITNPSYMMVGYHNLKQSCLDAQNLGELQSRIAQFFS